MIRVCAWCKESLGPDVEPLEDPSITHGICERCVKELVKDVKADTMKANPRKRKPEWFESSDGTWMLVFEGSMYSIRRDRGEYKLSYVIGDSVQYIRAYPSVRKAMSAVDHTQGSAFKKPKLNPGAAYHEAEAEQEEQTEQRARKAGKTQQAAFHRGKAVAHRQSETKARTLHMNPIAVFGNPGSTVKARVEGVVYNRLIEIRAEKTTHKPGFYRHPFHKSTRAQILALDNGDLLIHSMSGKRLWGEDPEL